MTRRRADSFIQVHTLDGRRVLIESPGQLMLDAVLKAIGIKSGWVEPATEPPPRRFTRAGDVPDAAGQAFRAAVAAIRDQDPVQ